MATFKFYLLPAEHCKDALRLHLIAQEDAQTAKRDLLTKYRADAILLKDDQIIALACHEKPLHSTGFTAPSYDKTLNVWVFKPKNSASIGKKAIEEMEIASDLLGIWHGFLERYFAVDGYVFGDYNGNKTFLRSVARPLPDGRVVINLPVCDADTDHSDDLPTPPSFAIEITREKAEALLGTSLIPKQGESEQIAQG